jgi:hypothetical protein
MTVTIDTTEEQVFTALRSYLLVLFPSVEIVQGLDNRVPMPACDFITMTAVTANGLSRPRLGFIDTELLHQMTAMSPTKKTIQVDFYGETGNDRVVTLKALFNNEWSYNQFSANIKPLSTGEARRIDFSGEDQQNIIRWSIDLDLQYNPIVTVPMQFADELGPSLIEVDAEYPQ